MSASEQILVDSTPSGEAVLVPGTVALDRYSHSIATFTRPADTNPYAQADLIANSTNPANVVPMVLTLGQYAQLDKIVLTISGTAPSFAGRALLFKNPPMPTVGDNGSLGALAPSFSGNNSGAPLACPAGSGFICAVAFGEPGASASTEPPATYFSDAKVMEAYVPPNGYATLSRPIRWSLPAGQTQIYALLQCSDLTGPSGGVAYTPQASETYTLEAWARPLVIS